MKQWWIRNWFDAVVIVLGIVLLGGLICSLFQQHYPVLRSFVKVSGWVFVCAILAGPVFLYLYIVIGGASALYQGYRENVEKRNSGWLGRIAWAILTILVFILWVTIGVPKGH